MNGVHDMGGMHGWARLKPTKVSRYFTRHGKVAPTGDSCHGRLASVESRCDSFPARMIAPRRVLSNELYERWITGLVE